MRIPVLFIFCLLIFSCEQPTAQEEELVEARLSQAEIEQIKIEIDAERKSLRLKEVFERKKRAGFNGAMLAAQRGIILLEEATGVAHDSIKNTIDSKFQLASLSKTFTALSIMKLAQEGKLGLEDNIQDFFPDFPYSGVTLRSLLSHRSGLPYYEYSFDKKARSGKIYPDNQMIMQWFSEASPRPHPMNKPDHYFGYNNTNYAVLAAIIEKVSGQTFAEYIDENICKPAGMNDTYALTTADSSININRTYGYQNGRKLPKDIYDDVVGDKGIYSSAPDLLKYYQVLKEGTIVNKEYLREMYTPRSFEHPGIRNYGYGFRLWVNELQQTEYIYHTGWWKGYNTIMFFDLRNDFVLIVLSNKYNRDVYNIKEMVDILHGEGKSSTLEENILDL